MVRMGALVSLCLLACSSQAEDVPDDLGAACQRQAECAGQPFTRELERDCRERLLVEYDAASSAGCATQHADWVSCLATTRGSCAPAGSDAEAYVDPCQGQRDAFTRCQDLGGGSG